MAEITFSSQVKQPPSLQQLMLIVAVSPSALIRDHTAISTEVAWEVAVLPFLSRSLFPARARSHRNLGISCFQML